MGQYFIVSLETFPKENLEFFHLKNYHHSIKDNQIIATEYNL